MTNKIFNAAFIVLIVIVGLAAAYILFGVLDSEASGGYQGYSLAGAAAGFVVVELLLFSTYQQLRKSDQEDLQEQINQLQQKIIRGAPRPPHFETEVAERERIVLARPQDWKPGAGIIFDFQTPNEESGSDYDLIPEFRCSYAPILEEIGTAKAKILWWQNRSAASRTSDYRKQFYDNYRRERLEKGVKNHYFESYTCEFDYVGGEPNPTESLRIITHEYAEVIPQDPDPATQVKRPPRWRSITKQRYEELPTLKQEAPNSMIGSLLSRSPLGKRETPALIATGSNKTADLAENGEQDDIIARPRVDSTDVAPASRATAGSKVVHALVISYHEHLGKVYYFEFWATPEDFIQTSAKFNQILNSVRFLS